jgi:flagellar hook protein FlgE
MSLLNFSASISALTNAGNRMGVSADRLARASVDPENSDVDMATELVNQVVIKTDFEANLKAADTQLKLLGQLVSIKV